jgi:tRNA A37 threonylcarbamoyladenosine biosynthesis protein TsaE
LGFKEIISDPKNIAAVEWAERIKKIMPKNTVWIKFDFIDENKRKIQIKNQILKSSKYLLK